MCACTMQVELLEYAQREREKKKISIIIGRAIQLIRTPYENTPIQIYRKLILQKLKIFT